MYDVSVWQEIVAALHGGCRIIPITDEAFLWPDEDALPVDIRAVTRYQAIPLVHPTVKPHIDNSLIDASAIQRC